MGTWVVPTFRLLWTVLLWTSVYRHQFMSLFSVFLDIRWGLSGKSTTIVNIMRTVCRTLMQPVSQGEWTGMRMREQWWLHCSSQWGGRCCWVSMCTVWSLHSKCLSQYSNESPSNFALSINIPLQKLFRWFRMPQLWATSDWQLYHDNVPAHASCLMYSFLVKHQITQVTQPPYGPDLVPCDF